MWPAARMPFTTREGYELAPIEPGARWNIEPCVAAPPRKLWRFTTPWNPWPLLVPITSTYSPALNTPDTSTCSPAAGAVAPLATLTSRRWRVGGTPAFLK
jgi:hypothetical protein